MPQFNKPQSLEDLAFEAIGGYVIFLGTELIACACSNQVQYNKWQKEEKEENSHIVLDTKVLSDFLYGSVPHVLLEKITKHILVAVTEIIAKATCTRDGFIITGDAKCRDYVRQLIVSSISPHLMNLDLSQEPKFIRKVMCENLSKLVQLKSLTVRTFDTWESTNELFLRDLPLLQNLLSFNMEHDCTDAVLYVIGQHCSGLRSLDVSGSYGVTDKSINSLIKLKCLDQLQVSATNMTEEGYIKLLKMIKQVNQESQNTTSSQSSKSICTSLKKIGSGLVRDKQLKLFVHNFPNLTQITLSTMNCDLSLLKVLKHLRELKLTGGNFETDNLKGLIKERGSYLQVLDLLLFQNVDLMLISKYSDDLRILNFRSCSFQNTGFEGQKKTSTGSFQKLQQLTFYVQCSLEYLKIVLIDCINVKVITIGLLREINDEFMSMILSKNQMRHLEKLEILFTTCLSLRTARLIMASCPALSVLVGLDTWKGISKEELCQFREELRRNNLNIQTYRSTVGLS